MDNSLANFVGRQIAFVENYARNLRKMLDLNPEFSVGDHYEWLRGESPMLRAISLREIETEIYASGSFREAMLHSSGEEFVEATLEAIKESGG